MKDEPQRPDVPDFTSTDDPDGTKHFENIDIDDLPIVPAGELLAGHEVYVDVLNLGHGPFRALEGQTAGSGNRYVAEQNVNPVTWDLLMRADGEARARIEAEAAEVADGMQAQDDDERSTA